MESTRIQIPNELFAPAESSHFEGIYDIGRLEVGPDEYVFDGPLAWSVDVTNTGEAFLVMGTVEGRATTLCGRCLEEVSIPLSGEVNGYYLIEPESAEDLEDMEGDEFDYFCEHGELPPKKSDSAPEPEGDPDIDVEIVEEPEDGVLPSEAE